MRRLTVVLVLALGLAGLVALPGLAAKPSGGGLYPDLQTVVPLHLSMMNQQQRDILRFSNGIANTGDGPWALRPDFQPTVTNAIQEIRR